MPITVTYDLQEERARNMQAYKRLGDDDIGRITGFKDMRPGDAGRLFRTLYTDGLDAMMGLMIHCHYPELSEENEEAGEE